jgi:hypothetical protein
MRMRILSGTLALAAMAACATSGTRMGSAGGDVMLEPSDVPGLPPASTVPSAPTLTSMTPPPIMPTVADLAAAYWSSTLGLAERVRILDGRAGLIDGLTNLSFRARDLDDDMFKTVPAERWVRLERWDDAEGVRKIRLVPNLDRTDTEELYYEDGRLIMVYWNPLGTYGPGNFGLPGESFYFGEEGLISWRRDDGTSVDSSHPDFKFWDKHLRKEARHFATCC